MEKMGRSTLANIKAGQRTISESEEETYGYKEIIQS
jgi:hypothetical protein